MFGGGSAGVEPGGRGTLMRVAIVGFPFSGKTAVFTAISGLSREQLKAADSDAIKVYALNKDNLYGKDIQYEAMKELTERTEQRSG